jgi:hypothetical protein
MSAASSGVCCSWQILRLWYGPLNDDPEQVQAELQDANNQGSGRYLRYQISVANHLALMEMSNTVPWQAWRLPMRSSQSVGLVARNRGMSVLLGL